MLNLKHLYYFHIFAQDFSTKEAAKRLGITSPALSNQLKELESFLGVQLTRRIGGKITVTEPGELVLNYAERMFSAYEDLKAKLTIKRDQKITRFRAGICQNLGTQFAFDLLSLIVNSDMSFAQEAYVTFDSSDKLIDGFKNSQFDLILGAFAPEPNESNLWISQSLSFPVRLFAPPILFDKISSGNRSAIQTSLTQLIELANSKQISLVLPTKPSILRTETERLLHNSEVSPTRTIECNSASAVVQLIERGFAMGFAPIPCLLDFRSAASLAVLGPPGGYWNHGISVFIKKGEARTMTRISPLAEMFSPIQTFN